MCRLKLIMAWARMVKVERRKVVGIGTQVDVEPQHLLTMRKIIAGRKHLATKSEYILPSTIITTVHYNEYSWLSLHLPKCWPIHWNTVCLLQITTAKDWLPRTVPPTSNTKNEEEWALVKTKVLPRRDDLPYSQEMFQEERTVPTPLTDGCSYALPSHIEMLKKRRRRNICHLQVFFPSNSFSSRGFKEIIK